MTVPRPRRAGGGHPRAPWALRISLDTEGDPLCYLARHTTGDWGRLCEHDRRENEQSLRHGRRIFSSYPVGRGRLWMITEADRSVTTILLLEEYSQ